MVFDKFEEIEIGGKKYKLEFPLGEVFKAERELESHNLLVTIANPPPSMGDMYVLFRHAVIGGKNGLSDEAIEQLYLDAMGEYTYMDVINLVISALQKSGVMGKAVKKAEAAEA